MKKINQALLILIILCLIIISGNLILAQQQGQQQGNDRRQPPNQGRQFDPQQMMERRMQQIMERLKLSEEETAVIKPQIESITNMRMEQSRVMRDLMDKLQKSIDSKDANQIKSALTAVKAKREEQKSAIEKAEKELIELLTVEQEANLTIMGVINSDGMGMVGFGFRPAGGPGGDQRPPNQGQGNPPNPNR